MRRQIKHDYWRFGLFTMAVVMLTLHMYKQDSLVFSMLWAAFVCWNIIRMIIHYTNEFSK